MSKEKITAKNLAPEDTFEYKEGKIGTMLHDVRTKKKLSIEDISKQLCIKTSYLTAIEKSDYEHIPADPYGTGFIRSYASFLGLNSTRLVQIYKEETKPGTSNVVENSAAQETEAEDDETANFYNLSELYNQNKKPILIGLAILVVVYALWNILSSDANKDETTDETIVTTENNDFPVQIENYTTETENDITDEVVNNQITISEENFEEDTPKAETKVQATPANTEKKVEKTPEKKTETVKETTAEKTAETKSETSATPKKSGRVVLKIKKETWVEVKDDDKLWISKVLHAGDEYVLPENGVGKTVSFGNTDGVDVVIDGKVVTIVSNNKKTNISMDPFLGNH